MEFQISIFQLLMVCAVFNNFTFSILLFTKRENRAANRFLSLFILSVSLTFMPDYLDSSIWISDRWLMVIPYSFSYWIGPCLYIYIRILIGSRDFEKSDLLHFAPIILCYSLNVYWALTFNNPYPYLRYFAIVLENGAIFSVITYIIVSNRLISIHKERIVNQLSYIDEIDLQWIRRFMIVILTSFALSIIIYLLSKFDRLGISEDQLIMLRKSMLVFYVFTLNLVGIGGVNQTVIRGYFEPEPADQSTPPTSPPPLVDSIIQQVKENKLYINPELSIEDLSRATGISIRSISNVINGELEKNFYQFINEFRVEEMKARLLDPKMGHLTIHGISLDSGFNSKATANRIFKSYTGVTPSEYKRVNFSHSFT